MGRTAYFIGKLLKGKYDFGGVGILKCGTKYNCPSLAEWKGASTKFLQPAIEITKGRLCTVLIVTNLAKPDWLSVMCSDKQLNIILCSTDNTQNETVVFSFVSKMSCSLESVGKDEVCYSFTSFKKPGFFTVSRMYKTFVQKITSETFLFLVAAVKGQFPPIIIGGLTRQSRELIYFKYSETAMFSEYKQINENNDGEMGLLLHISSALRIIVGQNVFACKTQKYISATFLCDGVVNCDTDDTSDEAFAVCKTASSNLPEANKYFRKRMKTGGNSTASNSAANSRMILNDTFVCNVSGKIVPFSVVNDLIPDCGLEAEDELQLKLILMAENTAYIYDTEKPKLCSRNGKLSCREGHFRCFFPHEICVFRLSALNHLLPCRNGAHLMECTQFECSAMFKCSSSYCILWHYVCNRRLDCPYGEEEVSFCSQNHSCIGMLSCSQSRICIHPKNLCDGVKDCLQGDDELLCNLSNTTCPLSCSCVLFTIFCAGVLQQELAQPTAFEILVIRNSTISFDTKILNHFGSLWFLQVHESRLEYACCKNYPLDLHLIDLRNNRLRTIESNCFGILKTLYVLVLADNNIVEIKLKGFAKLSAMQVLNMSHNPLHKVSEDIWPDLHNLRLLSLLSTADNIQDSKFLSKLSVSFLHVSGFYLCCEQSKCFCQTENCESCSDLQLSKLLKVFCISTSLLILVVSAMCTLLQMTIRRGCLNKYTIAVLYSTGNNMLLFVYLLLIGKIDLSYLKLKNEINMCYFAFMLFSWFSLQTSPFLVIFSFLRYSVVVCPMKTSGIFRTKLLRLYTSVCFTCFSLSGVILGVCVISNIMSVILCSPHISPRSTQLFFVAFSLCNALENFISSVVVIYFHVNLVRVLKAFQEETKLTLGHNRKNKSYVFLGVQLFLISFAHILSWYPLHLSGIAILFVDKFSSVFVHCFQIMSVPIQCLVTPSLLGITAVKNLLVKRSKSHQGNQRYPDLVFSTGTH